MERLQKRLIFLKLNKFVGIVLVTLVFVFLVDDICVMSFVSTGEIPEIIKKIIHYCRLDVGKSFCSVLETEIELRNFISVSLVCKKWKLIVAFIIHITKIYFRDNIMGKWFTCVRHDPLTRKHWEFRTGQIIGKISEEMTCSELFIKHLVRKPLHYKHPRYRQVQNWWNDHELDDIINNIESDTSDSDDDFEYNDSDDDIYVNESISNYSYQYWTEEEKHYITKYHSSLHFQVWGNIPICDCDKCDPEKLAIVHDFTTYRPDNYYSENECYIVEYDSEDIDGYHSDG